ncbi:MAG TPA: hypothetical protein DCM05_01925 [Elusimicrobia bacterium]|nr:hypothetical protein [Elusimicrobiota bacterium]
MKKALLLAPLFLAVPALAEVSATLDQAAVSGQAAARADTLEAAKARSSSLYDGSGAAPVDATGAQGSTGRAAANFYTKMAQKRRPAAETPAPRKPGAVGQAVSQAGDFVKENRWTLGGAAAGALVGAAAGGLAGALVGGLVGGAAGHIGSKKSLLVGAGIGYGAVIGGLAAGPLGAAVGAVLGGGAALFMRWLCS